MFFVAYNNYIKAFLTVKVINSKVPTQRKTGNIIFRPGISLKGAISFSGPISIAYHFKCYVVHNFYFQIGILLSLQVMKIYINFSSIILI